MSSIYVNKLPYCTYVTFYRGNKLPHFYVGSTTVERINRGYCGSVKSARYKSIWLKELKMNRDLFFTKIISTHETSEEAREKECFLQKHLNVIKNPLYINQSIAAPNGFFGRDVAGKNNPFYGKKHTKELLERWRKDRKGKEPWNKNKVNCYSEERLKKMKRPKTEEEKRKLRKPKSTTVNMGKYVRSEELKKFLAEKKKSIPKILCTHCNREFDVLNYSKWHGEKCKHKDDQ